MEQLEDERKEMVRNWIESGKQIGKTFSFTSNGAIYWSSIAIQKINNEYQLYITEILDDNVASEEYETEELLHLKSYDELLHAFSAIKTTSMLELQPRKGRKFFTPDK